MQDTHSSTLGAEDLRDEYIEGLAAQRRGLARPPCSDALLRVRGSHACVARLRACAHLHSLRTAENKLAGKAPINRYCLLLVNKLTGSQ